MYGRFSQQSQARLPNQKVKQATYQSKPVPQSPFPYSPIQTAVLAKKMIFTNELLVKHPLADQYFWLYRNLGTLLFDAPYLAFRHSGDYIFGALVQAVGSSPILYLIITVLKTKSVGRLKAMLSSSLNQDLPTNKILFWSCLVIT